jgi:ATP-binding cassette subfamily B protein
MPLSIELGLIRDCRLLGLHLGIIRKVCVAILLEILATVFRVLSTISITVALDYSLLGSDKFGFIDYSRWFFHFQANDKMRVLQSCCLVGVFTCILSVSLSFISKTIISDVMRNSTDYIRNCIAKRFINLPFDQLNKNSHGYTVSLLRVDAMTAGSIINQVLYTPLKSLVELCGGIFLVTFVDIRLLIISILLVPLVWLTHWSWNQKVQPLEIRISEVYKRIDSHIVEIFRCIRMIRINNQEELELSKLKRDFHEFSSVDRTKWFRIEAVRSLWDLILPSLNIILIWWIGYELTTGRLSTGDVILFTMCLSIMVTPLHSIADSIASFQPITASIGRISSFLKNNSDQGNLHLLGSQGRVLDVPINTVEFRNVSFRYMDSQNDAIRNVNIVLNSKEKIAIIGSNGSGKSSFINLLAGFYRPTSGFIKINDISLDSLDIKSYRNCVSLLDQEISMFSASICENISYSHPTSSFKNVLDCSVSARADEFVRSLPDSYEHHIGFDGFGLSGGQKQRLSIARTLLKPCNILILDELSNQLDHSNEMLIVNNILYNNSSEIIIIITHQLDIVKKVDRVLMFEDGLLVEDGSHDELINVSIRYQQFWNMAPISDQ